MPEIVYKDFYFTIWSLKNDVVLQDHFNKVGFSKIFAVDCLEISEAARLENPQKPKGTLYKFKTLDQLKMEILAKPLHDRLPKDMEAPGDVQAAMMLV